MGMLVHNIRLLPENVSISVASDGWKVVGRSNCTEENLLGYFKENQVDILMRENAVYGKSYLINQGIEMLICTKDKYVSNIELRICLSWFEEALKECYQFAVLINKMLPLKVWLYNDRGVALSDEKDFLKKQKAFGEEKYNVFLRQYPDMVDIRLTEGEFYIYLKQRHRKLFRFKRKWKDYKKL